MPDVKLQAAMEEIKAVLKKHDIGAYVLLASPTHMEFLREFAPTWSCMWIEEAAGGYALRIRAKRADFPSEAAHKKCLEDSVGMLLGFADVFVREKAQLDEILKMLGGNMQISHYTRDDNNPPRR